MALRMLKVRCECRYMVVLRLGGVYADVDTECRKPLNDIIRPQDTLIVSWENEFSTAEEARSRKYVRKRQVSLVECHHLDFGCIMTPDCHQILEDIRLGIKVLDMKFFDKTVLLDFCTYASVFCHKVRRRKVWSLKPYTCSPAACCKLANLGKRI